MEILGVTATVVVNLRNKIITGELHAGQKLNESQLASDFGISRPPLREAFRMLEQAQLLVSIPRKGTFVAEASLGNFIELYQAREMIECHAIDLIEEKGLKSYPDVESILYETSDLPLPPERDNQSKLDYLMAFAGFHHKIVEMAGNSQLIHFYRTISHLLARYQFMYAYLPGLTRDSQADHQNIYNFIKQGQYARAKEFLRSHIKSFVKLMESKMVSEPIRTAGSLSPSDRMDDILKSNGEPVSLSSVKSVKDEDVVKVDQTELTKI
jgi:DNA-binding GntR family transcriptional regulator